MTAPIHADVLDTDVASASPAGKHQTLDRRFGGAPGATRTPNLLIRSQTLYPIELRARNDRLSQWPEAKGNLASEN
jgi:hypothetical protein